MSIRNNATRAEIFFAFGNIHKEVAANIAPPSPPDLLKDSIRNDTRERLRIWLIGPLAANLLDTLHRLKAAFHPSLMLEHPTQNPCSSALPPDANSSVDLAPSWLIP